jgi:very-short-patch-repair endonuclease
MPLPGALIAHLSTHHAIVHRRDLPTLGVTEGRLKAAVARGELLRCAPSVYRVAAAPVTLDQQLAIACAVDPRVVISHHSAGRIHKFRRLGRDDQLHVTLPEAVRLHVGGVRMHYVADRYWDEVIERPDGIRLFTPARTLFDLAAFLHRDAVTSIFEQVLNEEMASIERIQLVTDRRRERGRTGSALMGALLDERHERREQRPVGSDLERRVERAIVDANLPTPERQKSIDLPNGLQIQLDFYWPDAHVGLEVDGTTWHGGYRERSKDYRRDRQLQRLGMVIIRVGEHEERDGLSSLVSDLRHLLSKMTA